MIFEDLPFQVGSLVTNLVSFLPWHNVVRNKLLKNQVLGSCKCDEISLNKPTGAATSRSGEARHEAVHLLAGGRGNSLLTKTSFVSCFLVHHSSRTRPLVCFCSIVLATRGGYSSRTSMSPPARVDLVRCDSSDHATHSTMLGLRSCRSSVVVTSKAPFTCRNLVRRSSHPFLSVLLQSPNNRSD
jgi:hypothetical protein